MYKSKNGYVAKGRERYITYANNSLDQPEQTSPGICCINKHKQGNIAKHAVMCLFHMNAAL